MFETRFRICAHGERTEQVGMIMSHAFLLPIAFSRMKHLKRVWSREHGSQKKTDHNRDESRTRAW